MFKRPDYFSKSMRAAMLELRNGTVSPSEYCRAHLNCIKEHNPSINALRFVAEEGTLDAAHRLVARNSSKRLSGAIFAVKDHIDVAGMPQSLGTLRGAIGSSNHTANAVQLLLDEGALCVGKTNMPELAKSYSTENKDFGRTNNPHNLDFSPGGSSGGDAAAVASGMVDFALGADSSGSLRVPANFCGVFSLYPSLGSISHAGLSAFAHTTLSLFRSLGPITRSLDDLELIYQILCKYDPQDPNSVEMPHSQMMESMPASERRLKGRCLWFSQLGEVRADGDIEAALHESVERLKRLGFQVDCHTPEIFLQCLEPYVILGIQTSLEVDDLLGHTSPGNESNNLVYLRKALEQRLPKLSVEAVLRSWHAVGLLRKHAHMLFDNYDFIVAPVCGTTVVPHGTSTYTLHGKTHETQDVFLYSSAVNILGLPALSFPTHLNAAGLPVGLQLIGPRFHDRLLIQVVRDMGYLHAL